MAYDIGPRIGIDGEAEFRAELSRINASFKTLGSEMKVVTSAFIGNENSVEALTAKNAVLEGQLGTLNDRLELQKKMLAESAAKYGETDEKTLKWRRTVNETQAEINTYTAQIDENNQAISELQNPTKEAADAVQDEGEKAEAAAKRHEALKGALTAAGAAFAAVTAAAATAAVKLGKEVVSSFGELEQNLGGAEAVFGEYAKTIQKEGEEAYKNLGVSQSEYLATANKVGALFQGSGVEQQRSLELTTQAMQRAADMASVMGIDTQNALDAITGAAKGNYNMMDNLGVAMNATTLEAYALEKGFDTAFGKMSNAEKAEVAMQYFFENTEQYAGNFARESTETISGSLGLLQAATESLVAGLGNADADIGNLSQNVIDAFSSVLDNVVPVIQNISAALPKAVTGMMAAISPMLPSLVKIGTQLFSSVLTGLTAMLPDIMTAAVQLVEEMTWSIINNLPMMVSAALELIATLSMGIAQALPELLPAAVEAVATIAETLIDNVDLLIDSAIAIVEALGEGIMENLPTLLGKAVELTIRLAETIIERAPEMLTAAGELILQLLTGLALGLGEMVQAGQDLAGKIVYGIRDLWSDLKEAGSKLIEKVKSGIDTVIGDFVSIGSNIVSGIWEGISNSYAWITSRITEWVDNFLSFMKSLLKISSPSKVFRDQIGRYIALGVAEGIEDNEDEAAKAAEQLAKEVYSRSAEWADRQTKYQNYTLKEQLEVWETIQSQFIQESKQYADAEEKIFDLKKKIQDEYQKKVESVNKTIMDLENKYQDTLSKRTQAIFDSYKLFDEVPKREAVAGDALIENLRKQNATIEEFYDGLAELAARGVGEDLVADIRAMGPKAVDELTALLNLSDEKLTEYAELYQEKQALANAVAIDELAGLREETDRQIAENLAELEALYKENAPDVGTALTDGMAEGILDGMSDVVNAAVSVAQSAVDAVRDTLGIASPSKVFRKIGGFMAEGMSEGFADEVRKTERNLTYVLPSPELSMADLTGAFGDFQNAFSDFTNGDIVLDITTTIDGAVLARNQYRYNIAETERVGPAMVKV